MHSGSTRSDSTFAVRMTFNAMLMPGLHNSSLLYWRDIAIEMNEFEGIKSLGGRVVMKGV